MGEKVNNIEKTMQEIKDDLGGFISRADSIFATKSELTEVRKKHDVLQNNISWGVKIIIGAVILAILGLVINQNMR